MTAQARIPSVDATHAPDLVSWVESAHDPSGDFPMQNLPLGCARIPGRGVRPCVAIGRDVLDLAALGDEGLLNESLLGPVRRCAADESLNPLLGVGAVPLAELRHAVSHALRADGAEGARARSLREVLLRPSEDVELLLPARIGDYTDFYASIDHARRVGSLFRPHEPLLPNYRWVPIGYHGRASSIVASGTAVRRPVGQVRDDPDVAPQVRRSQRLDYEAEVGIVIGAGNVLGAPIAIGAAESHVAGLCLVNDWSARDIQAWEYQPLGPFLAKNFASTVSPWIVTADALAPFRAPAFDRPDGDPAPLPYLTDAGARAHGAFAITLEVSLTSLKMREAGMAPFVVSRGSFQDMYWTIAQLMTHHASNGCNLRAGDLIGSGTISGAEKSSRGCLLEMTWRGAEPVQLPTGETRAFLADGDEVIFRGWCERDGAVRIGFGECRGEIRPAQ